MALDLNTTARILDEDYAPLLAAVESEQRMIIADRNRQLYTNPQPRNQPMSIIQGHECDRCGKQKMVTPGGNGALPVNRDGYDPALPKGWVSLHAFPNQITLCKSCQKRAGLR